MTTSSLASGLLAEHVALVGFLLGLGLNWWATGRLIPHLVARQLGKAIRLDGPAHGAKAGTATMGGLPMLAAILVAAIALALWARVYELVWLALAVLGYGTLGWLDDLAGLARRSGGRELGVGMGARQMLAAQTVLALALGLWRSSSGAYDLTAGIGLATLAVFVLAVVGTVNGVNLADGLDGLAAGTAALAFGAFAILLLIVGPGDADASLSGALGALSATACGACVGFLGHNRHPARVFMGNVGSMALGATLAMVAMLSEWWWLLPLIAGVFVIEVLSDLVQIGYFRLTGGRRLLRMAPLHHHFEASGLSETTVVGRFCFAGLVCALAGLLLAAWIRG